MGNLGTLLQPEDNTEVRLQSAGAGEVLDGGTSSLDISNDLRDAVETNLARMYGRYSNHSSGFLLHQRDCPLKETDHGLGSFNMHFELGSRQQRHTAGLAIVCPVPKLKPPGLNPIVFSLQYPLTGEDRVPGACQQIEAGQPHQVSSLRATCWEDLRRKS